MTPTRSGRLHAGRCGHEILQQFRALDQTDRTIRSSDRIDAVGELDIALRGLR